jgi:hypothetical protein
MATGGRLEGRITVPTGGWTATVGGSTATIAAGRYYPSTLLTAVGAAFATASGTTCTASASIAELGTGLVSISFAVAKAIVWVSTDLRDILGFTGNLSSASLHVGTRHLRGAWIPGCAYQAPNVVSADWQGTREADVRSVSNASGYGWTHMGPEKIVNRLSWANVPRARTWMENESTVGASFEQFARDVLWGEATWGSAGGPVRFYPDAGDIVYATYAVTNISAIRPTPLFEDWAGGPWTITLPRLVVVPSGAVTGFGLDVDDYTVGLWRMNELTAGTYLTASDSRSGARHLAAAAIASAPKITDSSDGRRYARVFNGSTTQLTRAGDATCVTNLIAEWTLECLIRPDSLSGDMAIVGYAASGETSATNILMRWDILSTGMQRLAWEQGAGVDVNHTQTTGTAVVAGQWQYLAVVKTATHIRFFVNGSLVQAIARGTNASGGTSSTWFIGSNIATNLWLAGAVGGIKMTTSAKADADITAVNATLATDYALADDGFIFWQFNEPPDAIDEGPYALHLYATAAAEVTHGASPLVSDGGKSKTFTVTGSELVTAPPPDAGVVALRLHFLSSYTFECWVKVGAANAITRSLYHFGVGGPETEADNVTGVDISAARIMSFLTEYGAGTDNNFNCGEVYATEQALDVHYFAIRVTVTGSTMVVDAFRNGVKLATSGTLNAFTGGTNNALRLGANGWYGSMDEVRISRIARTDAEIMSSYLRGAL